MGSRLGEEGRRRIYLEKGNAGAGTNESIRMSTRDRVSWGMRILGRSQTNGNLWVYRKVKRTFL